jgi:MFS family permease
VLLVLRFLQGIGAAPLSSLNIAFIIDMYSGNRRITTMGYNQAVLSIGAAVCTALGGALATLGWFYPFLVPILGIPIGLLVLFRLKSPRTDRKPALGEYFQNVANALNNRELVAVYLITIFGLIMVWGSYISYFPILMGIKLQQKPLVIGLIMTSMTVFSALSSAQMGRLSKRFSSRDLLKVSFALYCAALLMIPFINQRWLFLVPISTFGIAQGIFIPNLHYFLGKLSSMENRGIVMAFYGSCIRIGQAIGPFAMGLIYPAVGINGVFFVCAGIAFALIVFVNASVKIEPEAGRSAIKQS